MSEVKRISVFMHGPNKKIDMVEAVRLDRVTAERDALQLRLTAADERAEVLEGLLREVQKSARKQDWAGGYPTLFASVDAALKPAERVEPVQCIDQQGSKVKVGVAYQVSFAFKEATCVVVEAINEDGSVNCYDVHFKMKVENVHPGTLWRPLKHTWAMWPADVERVTEYVGAQALDLTP